MREQLFFLRTKSNNENADTFGFMEGDVLLAGERVRLKVMHNGGDDYDTRLEEELRKCDIVILLFDITSKPTMEKLKSKVQQILDRSIRELEREDAMHCLISS